MIDKQATFLKINKYFKRNKISIFEIQKYLKKEGVNANKKNIDSNSINILSRTFLSSLIIISIFFISPIILEFKKSSLLFSNDFENKSKNDLVKLLEKKDNKSDELRNHKFLFEDILTFDEEPNDSVRLSAATIEELFKSTNYSLDDVRKNKLVKPISLTLLPSEIKKIINTKKRKDFFIQIILPLVIKENNHIRLDRKKLFSILNKSKNTRVEQVWLNLKFKEYGVANKDLSTLKTRMDEIPASMTIAQAAKETGWGTSRFAQEGNALFGQWTWDGEGIKPSEADNFRIARAELRDEGKKLDSITLSRYLDKYAETGKEYIKVIHQIIKQNNLTDFDDAKLLPSSINLESLI